MTINIPLLFIPECIEGPVTLKVGKNYKIELQSIILLLDIIESGEHVVYEISLEYVIEFKLSLLQ